LFLFNVATIELLKVKFQLFRENIRLNIKYNKIILSILKYMMKYDTNYIKMKINEGQQLSR